MPGFLHDFKKLLPFIRPNISLLVVAMVMLLLSGAMEALTTALLSPIFNQLLGTVPNQVVDKFAFLQHWLGFDGNTLLKISLCIVLFSFCKGVFLFAAEYLMGFAGQKVVVELRNRLYAHLLEQSIGFFSRNSTGGFIARVIN